MGHVGRILLRDHAGWVLRGQKSMRRWVVGVGDKFGLVSTTSPRENLTLNKYLKRI
jgi:hypothetical protein